MSITSEKKMTIEEKARELTNNSTYKTKNEEDFSYWQKLMHFKAEKYITPYFKDINDRNDYNKANVRCLCCFLEIVSVIKKFDDLIKEYQNILGYTNNDSLYKKFIKERDDFERTSRIIYDSTISKFCPQKYSTLKKINFDKFYNKVYFWDTNALFNLGLLQGDIYRDYAEMIHNDRQDRIQIINIISKFFKPDYDSE